MKDLLTTGKPPYVYDFLIKQGPFSGPNLRFAPHNQTCTAVLPFFVDWEMATSQ